MLKINVTGYRGCDRIARTFYARDEQDFGRQVLAWEVAENIIEWSRDQR